MRIYDFHADSELLSVTDGGESNVDLQFSCGITTNVGDLHAASEFLSVTITHQTKKLFNIFGFISPSNRLNRYHLVLAIS